MVALVTAACSSSRTSQDVSFDTYDGDPDWSPDGRLIAFTSNRGDGGIYILRQDGTGLQQVFHGDASDVDWSPDSRRIAFVGEDGLYVVDTEGNLTRVLRSGFSLSRLVLGRSEFSRPAWSPDGRLLAVVQGVLDTAIHVVRPDGTGVRRLLPRHEGPVGDARAGSPSARNETEPAWSPDGREIAFQAGDGQLVVANVANGRRRTIDAGWAAYEPAWSPDGRLIAFQCEGDLCVVPSDGSAAAHRAASGGGDPSWSPDSREIVFERYLYGDNSFSDPQALSIVAASGDDLRELTYGPSLP